MCNYFVCVVGGGQESQRAKQQVISLRRENGTLDTECHDKERLINQLQTRVAVLEQEIKDKDQLVLRTKEVLEATQQQKVILYKLLHLLWTEVSFSFSCCIQVAFFCHPNRIQLRKPLKVNSIKLESWNPL